MNDARLNVTIALTAATHGATLVNHTEVLSLLKKPNPHKNNSSAGSSEPPPPVSVKTAEAAAANTLASPNEEFATDAGADSSAPAAAPVTPARTPSGVNLVNQLPPYTPSPPPAPDTPIQKTIESIKTYIFGSSKNKETDVEGPHVLGDQIVAGAVVRDSIPQ